MEAETAPPAKSPAARVEIRAVSFNFETKVERLIPIGEVHEAWAAGEFCWLDIETSADPRAAREALVTLGVNEIAIGEALGPDVDGRHDLYEDCLHIAFTSATYEDQKLVPSHVDMIIGEHFMVALRRGRVEFIEQVRRHYRRDFIKFARSPSFMLYEYWDQLIESAKKTYRRLEARAEEVQRQIFGDVDDTIFNNVAAVTQDLLSLRKIVLACREVLHELTTRRSPFVMESALPSLERLAGAMDRLVADVTVQRDALAESLNLYMGMVSHRTNKIVSRLTVISMVFLPLTFLVGVYGMNFKWIPETELEYGYFILLAVMAVVGVSLLVFMKWRKWW